MSWFRNHYQCERCGGVWMDEWSCTCDDDCPHCGARHMSPVRSDDLTAVIDEKPDGRFAVLRSPEAAEHAPDYNEVAAFPSRGEAETFTDGKAQGRGGGRRLRSATERQSINLRIAVARLKDARNHLKRADCSSTLKKVKAALRSSAARGLSNTAHFSPVHASRA